MSTASVFINKTSNNVFRSRSTHEERRLINRQNRSHRKRQNKRSTPPTSSSDSDRSENTFLATKKQNAAQVPSNKSSNGSVQHEANEETLKAQQVALTHFINAVPPGSVVDPFNAWSKPLDELAVPFLQYYERFGYQNIWRDIRGAVKYELDPRFFEICTPQYVISECLIDEGRMCSLIANMARNMDQTDNARLQADSVRFMQSALNALLLELRRKAPNLDDNVLLNAYDLFLAATADQDIVTTRVHARGIRAILDHMLVSGNLIRTSIAAMLAVVDVNLPERCLELWPAASQPKLLSFAKQTTESLSSNNATILPKSKFFLPQHAPLVTRPLSLLLSNCLEFAGQCRSQLYDDSQGLALVQSLSIEQRSLSQQIVDVEADNDISRCLLQGLLTWIWLANLDTRRLAATAAERLKEKLFDMPADSWQDHEPILLWLCIVGAMAAKAKFTQRIFVRKAIIQQNYLGLDQSEDNEDLQRQFLKKFALEYLWLDNVQDDLLKRISWRPSTRKASPV